MLKTPLTLLLVEIRQIWVTCLKSDFEELPGIHFKDDEDDTHDLEDEEDDVPISSIQNKKQRNEDLGGDELDNN